MKKGNGEKNKLEEKEKRREEEEEEWFPVG